MTLRLKIHLIVGLLTALFVAGLAGVQLAAMRSSVQEEVVAANRVAAQLLRRMGWLYAAQGTPAMVAFLQGLGRVRANDIRLTDAQGRELYRSPDSPYKAGRDAPAWFAHLVAPPAAVQEVQFPDGRLEVRGNASRAVLDAWDSLSLFGATALGLLLAVHALVYWLVGRTVRPFGQIEQALQALQAGRFDARLLAAPLPPLPGREAAAIGSAFNQMVAELGEHLATERRAVRAEAQLTEQRELARWVDRQVEQERLHIARELHDELGQSVTAVRSMALSIAQRCAGRDAAAEQAARLIADESSRLYDAMHGLIPRLTPMVLDHLGLPDALADLAERTRAAHPGLQLVLQVALADATLAPDAALALYRAAQEGITNALRHGGARTLRLQVQAGADTVQLQLDDDGCGPAALPPEPGRPDGVPPRAHHGLRWLGERVQGLGGRLAFGAGEAGGACLQVWLPRSAGAAAAGPPAPDPAAAPPSTPLAPAA